MSKNIKIQVMKYNLKSSYVMLKSKNDIVICTINELTIKLIVSQLKRPERSINNLLRQKKKKQRDNNKPGTRMVEDGED